MKKNLRIGMLLSVALVMTARGGDIVFTARDAAVVVDPHAFDATQLAACEATNFLSRILGAPVPILAEPDGSRTCLVLGTNAWSRAAGVTLEGKARDSFVLKASGNCLYAAGLDDRYALRSLLKGAFGNVRRRIEEHQRATLFSVYEFLERFAGCRFYFPGPYGEIVPRAAEVRVPANLDETLSPRFSVRSVTITPRDDLRTQLLNWVRLRFQTDRIQCCHGLNSFHYAARFAATHPEYFCLGKSGERYLNLTDKSPKDHSVGQLCHTSGIWQEIKADTLAYLRGEPATSRGFAKWGKNVERGFIDLMPQDGMQKCFCEKCQAAYDLTSRQWANEIIWNHTIDVAKAITAAGLDGRVVQMAYTPYAEPPKAEVPENVMVMVAEGGPWAYMDPAEVTRQVEHVRSWREKLGRPFWLWTYPAKCNRLDIPDVPQMAPRAWGDYVRAVSKYVFGMFGESESDKFIFNYLNFYVFSRQGWDPDADVNAILDEHHDLMFGAGAKPMKALYELLERTWIKDVATPSVTRETDSPGQRKDPPDEFDLLMNVYSPGLLKTADGFIAAALKAVPKGSDETGRIAYIARELYGPIRRRALDYQNARSVERELARRKMPSEFRRTLVPSNSWTGKAVRRKDTVVDGSEGLAVDNGGKLTLNLARAGVELKPETRYRLTYFMKTGLSVAPNTRAKRAGVVVEYCEDRKRARYVQTRKLKGAHDWSAWSLEWTTDKDLVPAEATLYLRAHGVTGRLVFGGIAIEEIKQ